MCEGGGVHTVVSAWPVPMYFICRWSCWLYTVLASDAIFAAAALFPLYRPSLRPLLCRSSPGLRVLRIESDPRLASPLWRPSLQPARRANSQILPAGASIVHQNPCPALTVQSPSPPCTSPPPMPGPPLSLPLPTRYSHPPCNAVHSAAGQRNVACQRRWRLPAPPPEWGSITHLRRPNSGNLLLDDAYTVNAWTGERLFEFLPRIQTLVEDSRGRDAALARGRHPCGISREAIAAESAVGGRGEIFAGIFRVRMMACRGPCARSRAGARAAVLLWLLVAGCLLPSVLPVVTRQAASLRRASLGNRLDDGVAVVDALTGLNQNDAANGGGAASGRAGLMAPSALPKPFHVTQPGAGRASFWGEKAGVEQEVVVRRAGLAAKRAKHPRRAGGRNAPTHATEAEVSDMPYHSGLSEENATDPVFPPVAAAYATETQLSFIQSLARTMALSFPFFLSFGLSLFWLSLFLHIPLAPAPLFLFLSLPQSLLSHSLMHLLPHLHAGHPTISKHLHASRATQTIITRR